MRFFPERVNSDFSIRNETGSFVAVFSLAPPWGGEGGGGGPLSANTEIEEHGEAPPNPPRRSRRPLPASGERQERKSDGALQRFDQVGLFPGEAAFVVR